MSAGATLSSVLGMATRSLQTTQTSLATISHNISNVNTAGYTRQQVITANTSVNGFGTGVEIQQIRRVTDSLLVDKLTGQKSGISYATTHNAYLNSIENIFGTPGADSSTEKLMSTFFNSMSTLANAPDTTALKTSSINYAEFVADNIQGIYNELETTALRADEQINNEIEAVNAAILNVWELNNEISEFETVSGSGANVNDLIDERQRQIDIIAETIPVTLANDGNGRVRVTSESGRRIVDTAYVQLERTGTVGTYQDVAIRPVDSEGNPSSTVLSLNTDDLSGGRIKALVDIRDTEIGNFQAELDELASVMIAEVNLRHSQGIPIPPLNSMTSDNGHLLSSITADVTDPNEWGITAGSTFEVSIVDIATGTPIAATLTGGGSITINAGDTITDITAAIQANADVGGLLTAGTTVDASGNPQMVVTANNANHAVIFRNTSGNNPVGHFGFNNFFTGTGASDIAVRQTLADNPDHFATAQMRDSDGGVSFLDNRNVTAMAQMNDNDYSFDAAGTIGARSDSITGYFIGISSNMAIRIQDTNDRLAFQQSIYNDLESRVEAARGVNMDEELSQLIVYQRSYQASARIISVIDEMMNTLVNSL